MIEKTHPIAQKLILTAVEDTLQLEQLLTDEALLLAKKVHIQTLDSITQQKMALVKKLATFARQVEQVLASEKLSQEEGMLQYFAVAQQANIDTSISLTAWHKLTEHSKNCRSLNEKNGACIHILNQHSARILNILKGKPQLVNTYGRNGRTSSNRYSQTLVSV